MPPRLGSRYCRRLKACLRVFGRWAIPASRNVNDDLVFLARPGVVFGQTEPESPSFHPDDRIDLRLECRVPVENIDCDLKLLQRLVRFLDGMPDHVPQETLESRRAAKSFATADGIQHAANSRWSADRILGVALVHWENTWANFYPTAQYGGTTRRSRPIVTVLPRISCVRESYGFVPDRIRWSTARTTFDERDSDYFVLEPIELEN